MDSWTEGVTWAVSFCNFELPTVHSLCLSYAGHWRSFSTISAGGTLTYDLPESCTCSVCGFLKQQKKKFLTIGLLAWKPPLLRVYLQPTFLTLHWGIDWVCFSCTIWDLNVTRHPQEWPICKISHNQGQLSDQSLFYLTASKFLEAARKYVPLNIPTHIFYFVPLALCL